MSSVAWFQFTVEKIYDSTKSHEVDILCLANDKLLIGNSGDNKLFIYSHEGHYQSSITIDGSDNVYDAVLTFFGNIVYSTTYQKKIVLMSISGKIIRYNQMKDPKRLSISDDSSIYLADYVDGVFQSTDDGDTWVLAIKAASSWQCWQAIKVTTDNDVSFWLRGRNNGIRQVRIYSKDKKYLDSNVTWRDKLLVEESKQINLTYGCLLYDGWSSVFLSDSRNKAVHVFSARGHYSHQLLASNHFMRYPRKLIFDTTNQLLYVGEQSGFVEVFKLGKRNGSYYVL